MDKGAIVSALTVTSLAGGFSLFNLLVTKDQRISEFRQEWIDGLRTDLADLVAHAHILSGHIKTHTGDPKAFVNETAAIYEAINQVSSRVRLRLNHKEKQHSAVMATMDEMENLLDIKNFILNQNAFTDLEKLTRQLVSQGAVLLKTEWERVKTGETLYRVGKWLTGLVLALSFLSLLYVMLVYQEPESKTSPQELFHPISGGGPDHNLIIGSGWGRVAAEGQEVVASPSLLLGGIWLRLPCGG